ncbi:MAG TPA: amylo-alpha-1,6-glucosidase [Acetobacteraceae bacterium]|jgi:glycogen debranching enzyme|nr:amylo-alpha-1,6-glucosidase [Acetobacteraceae bacterium]
MDERPPSAPPEAPLSFATSAPAAAALPFGIGATESLQERRPRTLKHGDTFAMFDASGNIPPGPRVPEGVYHRDTRYLSRFDMHVGGGAPMLLSSTMRDDNATLTCDLTSPDMTSVDGEIVDRNLVHLRRTKFVFDGSCFERIAARNFGERPQRIPLEFRFAADFADLFEVRGRKRPRRGEIHPPRVGKDSVLLAYTGLDDLRRTTLLRFFPVPQALEPDRAVFVLELPPGGRCVVHLDITCDSEDIGRPPLVRFYVGLRDARRALHSSSGRAAAIATDNDVFNETVRRSVADLYMLATETAHGPYPYAGIPWFSTAFGRDALVTALMMLWMDPAMARGVLGFLAANQATAVDAVADAEPGKILHELRHGEMAELGEVPYRRYYGSVDSTPLFVMLAGAYFERTGDILAMRQLWPNILAALDWIDAFGDRDGDGFVEYFRRTSKGLANQGWKDSYDAVFHADGGTAVAPIALCEVQAYVYAARLAAAGIARALGHDIRAETLEHQAQTLRERIDEHFWSDAIGTYALALDRDKRPCLVRTSNAGHMLIAGVPSEQKARAVAAQLLGSNFCSGWGVRTLAAGEPRYNPMSYHNGSVWPHDNAMLALGFGRYGMRAQAARLLEGLFDASAYIDLRRLPELVCGFPRRPGQGPTFYPAACSPQAWAAAAPLSLLQSCLGISFDTARRVVHFDRPALPRFTDRVTLRGLSLPGARIDVVLQRSGDAVAMSVLARTGEIRAAMTS